MTGIDFTIKLLEYGNIAAGPMYCPLMGLKSHLFVH